MAGLDGLLAVYKPQGLISKDVSRRIQKILGRVKLGHVGTLDPNAEGILPILLGRATRMQDPLLEKPKTYVFDVQFGIETDTLDIDGSLVREAPFEHVSRKDIEDVVAEFEGRMEQVPPLYSAVKFKGKPLYAYARRGQADLIDIQSFKRTIEIYHAKVLGYENGRVRLEVRCSKGTYVRVLGQTLAERLGTCGTVVSLQRSESAGLTLEQAEQLPVIEESLRRGDWTNSAFFIPLEELELDLQKNHRISRSLVT